VDREGQAGAMFVFMIFMLMIGGAVLVGGYYVYDTGMLEDVVNNTDGSTASAEFGDSTMGMDVRLVDSDGSVVQDLEDVDEDKTFSVFVGGSDEAYSFEDVEVEYWVEPSSNVEKADRINTSEDAILKYGGDSIWAESFSSEVTDFSSKQVVKTLKIPFTSKIGESTDSGSGEIELHMGAGHYSGDEQLNGKDLNVNISYEFADSSDETDDSSDETDDSSDETDDSSSDELELKISVGTETW